MSIYKPWQPDYELAYGWNNASALRSIESLIPNGDRGFVPVQGYSAYNAGNVIIRMDGLIYLQGFPSAVWIFSAMTRAQYQYLIANYTVGGISYSGYVTLRTRKDSGSFANFNAVINLPLLPELQRARKLYRDVPVRFSRLVAI